MFCGYGVYEDASKERKDLRELWVQREMRLMETGNGKNYEAVYLKLFNNCRY